MKNEPNNAHIPCLWFNCVFEIEIEIDVKEKWPDAELKVSVLGPSYLIISSFILSMGLRNGQHIKEFFVKKSLEKVRISWARGLLSNPSTPKTWHTLPVSNRSLSGAPEESRLNLAIAPPMRRRWWRSSQQLGRRTTSTMGAPNLARRVTQFPAAATAATTTTTTTRRRRI